MKVDMPTVTKFAILMALASLLLYDLYAVYAAGFEATISVVVFTLAKQAPIIPFLAGVLVGHLFWPIEGSNGTADKKHSDGGKKS